MKRLLVLCEGQTEETFFKQLVVPHLAEHGVHAACTLVCTSREEGRRARRGGHAHRYALIRRDVRHLLLDGNPNAVSTLLDLYAFPRDLPGFPDPMPLGTEARATAIETAFAADIGDSRFIPNIVAHEFEGLLFTEPGFIAEAVSTSDAEQADAARRLTGVAENFTTPEDINDTPDTTPSRRIERALPGYSKARHGPVVAARIGLAQIRAKCPHFAAWMDRLERLSE